MERIGKYMAYLLRHHPEDAGLDMDEGGWVEVPALINSISRRYGYTDMADLEYIVEHDNKQRYSFNPSHSMIRAVQGHSIPVNLGLSPITPPDILWHGTAENSLPSIMASGILPYGRNYVHLSSDAETAKNVGTRHGAPAVLSIDTKQMSADGYVFYRSENGVWLTDKVPPMYLTRIYE